MHIYIYMRVIRYITNAIADWMIAKFLAVEFGLAKSECIKHLCFGARPCNTCRCRRWNTTATAVWFILITFVRRRLCWITWCWRWCRVYWLCLSVPGRSHRSCRYFAIIGWSCTGIRSIRASRRFSRSSGCGCGRWGSYILCTHLELQVCLSYKWKF